MIGFSYRRAVGGPRYSTTQRTLARLKSMRGDAPTLTGAAVSAMTDPDGMTPVVDVMFELESNRLGRPVTTRLLVDGNSVGVRDSTVMALGAVANGRTNPDAMYAITDVTRADEARVFGDVSQGAETPVAFGGTVAQSTPVPNGGFGTSPSGWSSTATGDGTAAVPPVGAPTIMSPDATGNALVLVVANGSTALRAGSVVEQVAAAACRYQIGASGSRTFTVTGVVRTSAATSVLRWNVAATVGGVGGTFSASSARFVDDGVTGAGRRFVGTVTITGAVGAFITAIRPQLRYVSGGATRLELDDVQLYAGPERSPVDGRLASCVSQTGGAVVEQTWTDGRVVNRVEVHGEARGGQITSAAVQVQTAVGGGWSTVGVDAGQGRLAIDIPVTTVYGVRCVIEETSNGAGTLVWVQEVDVLQMLDVSGDVASLELQWSREVDPGQSTTPYGEFQASSLSMQLDDTAGRWNPARNAALDVGHRVEVAVGNRFANQLGNPRGEVNATGWPTTVTRVSPLPPGAPLETGLSLAGTAELVAPHTSVVAAAGQSWRLTAWVDCVGPTSALATVALRFLAADGSTLGETRGSTVKPADGWVPVTVNATAPANTAAVAACIVNTPAGVTCTTYATRLDLEQIVAGRGVQVEEMLPAGVFYTEPYDTASNSETVSIDAVDRFGRYKDVTVDDEVRVGQNVGQVVADLALRYMDLDADQLTMTTGVSSHVIPYAYPTDSKLGAYLADLAKSTLASIYIDPLERLSLAERSQSSTAVVAEVRADNALMTSSRPAGLDVTTSIVTVTTSTLVPGELGHLWSVPSGGLSIAQGQTLEVLAPFESSPAVGAYVTGIVADGSYTVVSTAFYSDRAVLRIRNNEPRTLVIATGYVDGYPLVSSTRTSRVTHEPSRRRYGPRELEVTSPMIQTQPQLDAVAQVLLDAFRSLDDDGRRRLPDLAYTSLGLLHAEAGDRVSISDPLFGTGADFIMVGRKLSYADGALVASDVRAREAPGFVTALVDVDTTDGPRTVGY